MLLAILHSKKSYNKIKTRPLIKKKKMELSLIYQSITNIPQIINIVYTP
jgi:hypothetical protein